jgi:hypothetical protein
MKVRSLCNHYHGTYRKEGEEFEHTGPLYDHIAPVEPEASAAEPEDTGAKTSAKKRGKGVKSEGNEA